MNVDESAVPHQRMNLTPKLYSETAVIASCDFNNDAEPFCNFRQDTADDSDWIRHKGPTPTSGTGPPGDYPDGSKFSVQKAFALNFDEKQKLMLGSKIKERQRNVR